MKIPDNTKIIKPRAASAMRVLNGTYFVGGAGMKGAYIPDMIAALRSVGMRDAQAFGRDEWSVGELHDSVFGVMALREEMRDFSVELPESHHRKGQLNLIGYSFGSLIAAQVAASCTRKGFAVDHLVLVGSPISEQFLHQLQNRRTLGRVLVRDLTEYGDPIHAGMRTWEVIASVPTLYRQKRDCTGHFYYALDDEVGAQRRRALAQELHAAGLR